MERRIVAAVGMIVKFQVSRRRWGPEVLFLQNGSFGGCPEERGVDFSSWKVSRKLEIELRHWKLNLKTENLTEKLKIKFWNWKLNLKTENWTEKLKIG